MQIFHDAYFEGKIDFNGLCTSPLTSLMCV